ncbi:MAG: hypothetical protein WAT84_04930 [Candidatus Moraniibacteriota bacterium]
MDPQPFFFGNAGGTCKTLEDVKKLATRTDVTHIEVGSITWEDRPGNVGDILWLRTDGTSVNALGMNNGGAQYYRRVLPEMIEIAHAHGKKLGVNIAAIDQGDTEKLCQLCVEARVDFITFNGGCPNVWVQGRQKKIISHDPRGLERELKDIFAVVGYRIIDVHMKLTLFAEKHELRREVASVLKPWVVTLLTTNTKPSTSLIREDGKPAISFRSDDQVINVGGMGGTELRPYAEQELREFHTLLPHHPIISVGAISEGQHLYDRLKMGAIGGQVGTAYFFTEDPHVFGHILTGYANLI